MNTLANKTETIGSLKKRADFLRVQQTGKKWVTRSFIIRELTQPEKIDAPNIRFGLTVTKRVFKNATDRNRVKRRLRAAIQTTLPENGKNNTDYVLIGRPETITRDFEDIKNDLKWSLKRLSEK